MYGRAKLYKEDALPVNFNVRTKIKINGKEYNSPEEMPADVRSLYEKALAGRGSAAPNVQFNTNSKITFNGQSFNNKDEMPEDVRRIYDSVMAAMDKDGDGIPDSMQAGGDGTMQQSAPLLPVQSPVTAPARANSRLIVLGLILMAFLLLVGTLLLALAR